MEDRLAQRSAANQAPQPEISGQDPRAPRNPNATTSVDEPVQTRPQGAPPSIPQAAPVAPVAPRQWIDSTPPIIVDTPRGPIRQDVLPPEPQPANPTRQIAPETDLYDRNAGFLLNNLIARPAAASTMPEGGPQRPAGQATQDAVQGRGQGYSDYTEATRGFRSDAPRRGTVEDMVAAEQAAQTAPPQASADAQGRAGRINETVRGLMPQSDPVTGMLDRLNRGGMSVAAVASDAAGVAQSAVGATDAGARSFDRAQGMRDARARMDQQAAAPAPQGGTTPAPAGTAQATPQQQGRRGTAQRTDETQFFIDDVPMSISGPKRLATGSVADVVAQVTGSPVVEGSVKAAGESIAKSAGMSAAQALTSSGDKKPPTKAEVLAVSKRAGKAFSREAIRAHERVLAQEGRLDQIPAWREYAQSENTRKAVEKLTEAMFYWDMNDKTNALQAVVELYNMAGYYDDGLSILSEGTAFAYDAAGNITGLTATFRDESTGNVFQRSITGPGDKIMAIVLGSLSPEATFEAALEAVGGIQGATARPQAPQMTPELSLKIDAQALRRAEKDQLGNPIPGSVEAEREKLMRNMGMTNQGGAQGDVPVWQ